MQGAQELAHHEPNACFLGALRPQQHRKDPQLNLLVRHGRGHALAELAQALLRLEERAVLAQRTAHRLGVGGAQLVGQKRDEIGLEVVGVQLHIGQPVAVDVAARSLAVQQDVVFHVVARDKALHREHHAVFGLHEAHRPGKALAGRHQRISRTGVVEPRFSKRVELLLELPFRVVPHHHAPVVEIGQRLRKPRLQLL